MDSTVHLKNYIRQCVDVSDAEVVDILSYFKQQHFPKKHLLLSEGEVCKLEGFIIQGCIKTYYTDPDGQDVIQTFATENWWISDVASFEYQTPSKMYIETIEPTELLTLSQDSKTRLLEEHPKLEKMFRILLQRHLRAYQDRLYRNIALPASERYQLFLEKNAHLLQRIPQHLIASYLGISPESLSRIRSKKS